MKRTRIPVSVRVRPASEHIGAATAGNSESKTEDPLSSATDTSLTVVDGVLTIKEDKHINSFAFAKNVVFGSSQVDSFRSLAGDLVDKLANGYSCTLIAYGQTGSGKT